MTDLFNYIGVMRFYAWEPHFQQKIEYYRKQETNNLLKEGIFFNLMTNMWNFSSMAVILFFKSVKLRTFILRYLAL